MASKQPPPITAAYLRSASLFYLKRFDANRFRLKRVLKNKIYRSVRVHGGEISDFDGILEAELDRVASYGYIDEYRFAASRFRAFRNRGYSTRMIRQKLRLDGVPAEIQSQLFDEEETGDPDLEAARTYARKKRLGVYGKGEGDFKSKQKDLARMARAGFAYHIAKQALNGEEPFT